MLLRHNTTQCVTTTAVLETAKETDYTVDKEVSIELGAAKWGLTRLGLLLRRPYRYCPRKFESLLSLSFI